MSHKTSAVSYEVQNLTADIMWVWSHMFFQLFRTHCIGKERHAQPLEIFKVFFYMTSLEYAVK